ncbi:MAG: CBS domain-containing protein [Nitriliruptorales bacterium]|nr:CBS domain-containing protein [Nitriliruptorales bacterium]
MSIRIGAILDNKGHRVHTLTPQTTVIEAIRKLKEHGVGALVVSSSGTDIVGIVSERDIVRRIAEEGAGCLDKPVTEIMTSTVTTCAPTDTSDQVMSLMTEGRMRHVPVVDGDEMVGVVSIGDVVKAYTDELEVTKEALQEYVTGSSY